MKVRNLMMGAVLAGLASMSQAAIIYDGTINGSETTPPGNGGAWGWSTALATSSGGPTPGFGAGHEINALYAAGDTTAPTPYISFGLAGNVQDGNRILLFLDTKSGGYNDGSFGRSGAPAGLDNWNGSNTFDSGFNADYVLCIGTDGSHANFYFDLFELNGTGSNTYLGSSSGGVVSGSALALGASPANSSNTQGFEVALANTALGYTGGDIKVFAAYIGSSGYLSNQFLTHAGSGDGNYTGGTVNFGGATPDPVTIAAAIVPEPSMLGLVSLGGLMMVRRRRSK